MDKNNIPQTWLICQNLKEWHDWLENNQDNELEVWLQIKKAKASEQGVKLEEAVDEALCFGWIDGVRRSVDNEGYCIRFTPRNPKSNWSAVNIAKVEELIRLGKMTPAGLAAYQKRLEGRSEIYSYENRPEKLAAEMEAKFREKSAAWSFFEVQAPSYKKTIIYWIMSAKQEATRISRLNKLITASAA